MVVTPIATAFVIRLPMDARTAPPFRLGARMMLYSNPSGNAASATGCAAPLALTGSAAYYSLDSQGEFSLRVERTTKARLAMPDALRIFIGWDSREAECADVMAYSIREHATCPVDIRFLKEGACRDLMGYDPTPRGASTEFTYTRFLIPYICNYQGVALFTDCDMVCYGDVADLRQQALDWDRHVEQEGCRWSLACVKHEPQRVTGAVKMDGQPQVWYPRKNWSSVMLLNCAALTHWTKAIVEHAPGAYLHRFLDIPDDEILGLDPAWNELYALKPDTRIRHWTEGGPWFEQCRDCQDAEEWLKWRDAYRASQDEQPS